MHNDVNVYVYQVKIAESVRQPLFAHGMCVLSCSLVVVYSSCKEYLCSPWENTILGRRTIEKIIDLKGFDDFSIACTCTKTLEIWLDVASIVCS